MPNLPKPIRLLLLLAALAAVALPASGCGTSSADPDRGRTLFVQRCGTCHGMAQAGTAEGVGPNLDRAFAVARAAGQDGDTIKGVVEAQVEYPRPATNNPSASMPADLVTGQDLKDVASYVALYAGVPGAAPPRVPGGPGAQVFVNSGCNSCHTLAAANAGGVTGPNLDEVLPGQSAAMVHQSIVDPEKVIAQGYSPGVMPPNYEQTLTPKELDDLVQYLVESTSGGKGASKQGAGG
jgi:mono/diheme cytochrome c family protein